MHQEQFPVPAYPDVAFPGISFVDLTKRAPNYLNTAKWYARLLISAAFLVLAKITTVTCYYFDLTDDVFFVATMVVTFILYLISMPVLTKAFVHSPPVRDKMRASRRKFYHSSLANTPLQDRLNVANNIWDALKDEQWTLCISYAHTNNKERTLYCCQQIGKIASEITHTDPDIFCDAMIKTSNNQRGSLTYFFDVLIMLGEHQFHQENEEEKKVRITQRLMIDDFFTHQ